MSDFPTRKAGSYSEIVHKLVGSQHATTSQSRIIAGTVLPDQSSRYVPCYSL